VIHSDSAGVFAVAYAGSASFAAMLPLAGARAVPPIVRLALALAMAPLVAARLGEGPRMGDLLAGAMAAAALGSASGLSANIIAGAAAAAGALIDGALGAPAGGSERIFGQTAGPFGTLVPLGFAFMMTSSGALTWLVAGYAASVGVLAEHFSPSVLAALGQTLFASAVTIALPALCAHAVATLVAGVIARLAPRVNGMLLAPALGSLLVLCVILGGATALFIHMAELSRLAVRAALL
jgi:flagellar biosynthesis protein FliR